MTQQFFFVSIRLLILHAISVINAMQMAIMAAVFTFRMRQVVLLSIRYLISVSANTEKQTVRDNRLIVHTDID